MSDNRANDVSDNCKYTEESPRGDEFNAVWKAALKKESCFMDQNVSNILMGLRVSRGYPEGSSVLFSRL